MPQIFGPDAVCEATGVNPASLQSWARPGSTVVMLHGHDERGGKGRGNHHGYSLPRILQIAIIGELGRLGVTPAVASNIAVSFTDAGGEVSFDGTPRPVGQLFTSDRTLLTWRPGKTYGDVVQLRAGAPWFDTWSAISEGCLGAVVLDLNRLTAVVRARLGIFDE